MSNGKELKKIEVHLAALASQGWIALDMKLRSNPAVYPPEIRHILNAGIDMHKQKIDEVNASA